MLMLPITITMRESSDTMRLLAQSLRDGNDAEVVVDAAPLRQFDTSALAVLLEVRRQAQAWSRPFSVRNAPQKLASLAQLYGVGDLLFTPEPGSA